MTSERADRDHTQHTEDLSRYESEGGSTTQFVSGSDQRGRLLLVYAAHEPHTFEIADTVAVRLRGHGFTVEVGDASTGMMPPPEDYDVIVLGMPMTFGTESAAIAEYIGHNRQALASVPTALFTVSDSGTARDRDPGGFLELFLDAVGWHPDVAAAFAGGEPFPRTTMLRRLAIATGHGGASLAMLRTDWNDVYEFADAIAGSLATAAVVADRTEPHPE